MEENQPRSHKQACAVVEVHLDNAMRAIDTRFGDGFARDNPALVASLVQACALENLGLCVAEAGWHVSQRD